MMSAIWEILLGSAADAYAQAKERRRQKEHQEWYRQFQDRLRELQEKQDTRAQETHNRDMSLRDRMDPLNIEMSEQKLRQMQERHPLELALLNEEVNLARKYNPLRLRALEENVRHSETYNPLLEREKELLIRQLLEGGDEGSGGGFGGGFGGGAGPGGEDFGVGFPENTVQKAQMFLDIRRMVDEYDVGSQYLNDIIEHADILKLALGEDKYNALLTWGYQHGPQTYGKGRKAFEGESYFGRNYKPGMKESPLTAYLKYLKLLQ